MNLNMRFIKNNRNGDEIVGYRTEQARGTTMMANISRTKEDRRHQAVKSLASRYEMEMMRSRTANSYALEAGPRATGVAVRSASPRLDY